MSLLDENPYGNFDDEEVSLWLAFAQIRIRDNTSRAKALMEGRESIKEVWNLSESELRVILDSESTEKFISQRKELEPERLLETVRKKKVDVYPYFHPAYPQNLREIHDPPLVLYIKGELNPDDFFYSIAVVGTRKPSPYGKQHAREISRDLAQRGVTIVSGMASGIDSIAHWGALEGKGKTVAVLACGPDVCYPNSNRALYEQLILEPGCAVVSEYFPGTRPEKWQFPARNRIISGLAKGTLVVEGGIDSGSLITAKIAFEQSREVFAIPGNINSPTSDGPNDLIARDTAKLTRGCKDIMVEFNWESAYKGQEHLPAVVQLFGREREVYEMLSAEPIHFDHLCQKTGMDAGEMSGTLTMLELAGIITRHHGDWYSKDKGTFINSAADNS